MKKKIGLLLVVSFFAFLPLAHAAEFLQSGSSGTLNVPAADRHKNLYAAGGTVTVNGVTEGDLTVAGGTITVGGQVLGGLIAAGGNISVTSSVGGNARIAGGSISLNAPLGGDVLVGGGSIDFSDAASVAGDIVAGGGTVNINSTVSGNIYVAAGSSLSFGPKANVSGVVYYRGTNPAVVDAAAHVPDIRYTHVESRHSFKGALAAIGTIGFLIQLVALWLVGYLALRFRSRTFAAVSAHIQEHFWSSLGLGLLFLIVIPIVVIILFLTFIGYYIGAIVLLSYILFAILTTVAAVLFTGEKVLQGLGQRHPAASAWLVALIGAIVWQLLKLIPVVGWIVLLVLFLAAFGGMLVVFKRNFHQQE